MASDWQVLTRLTGGTHITVERVRIRDTGVCIDAAFELPPLALLPAEDQVFVAAFVRSHGSIKEMEELFGVSYPTIKNRLNRIGAALPTAEIAVTPPRSTSELLTKLERGEMSVRDVLDELRPSHD
jgi:hypothetical protein